MSRTLIIALCGVVGSAGLVLLLRGLVPRSVPFAVAYDRFHQPLTRKVVIDHVSDGGMFGDLGALTGPRSYDLLSRWGYDFASRTSDLRILRISEAQFAFRKLALGLTCSVVPVLMYGLSTALGLSLPAVLSVLFAIVGLAFGFFLPDFDLKQKAEEAREDHVTALSAYLELTRALIASHMSPESALTTAANQGTGPAFEEYQAACLGVVTTKQPIHSIFDQLGEDLGIPELRDLAGSLALASEKGASVDDALEAKSLMLTNAQMLNERSEANSATARMSAPLALLGLTFTVFLALPAIAALINSTSGNSGF